MAKYTIIPKGYRLTVTSWENDADNYKTEVMLGLSKEETVFVVELISILESKNGCYDKTCFGNMYDPSMDELASFSKAVQDIVAKHDVANMRFADYFNVDKDSDSDIDDYDPFLDGVTQFLAELGLSSGEFTTRVISSFRVEFIPEDIKIQDVTGLFK